MLPLKQTVNTVNTVYCRGVFPVSHEILILGGYSVVNQEKNCYLGINGQRVGPSSESDIRAMYESGKITGDTKFVRAGMSEWINLSESGIIHQSLQQKNVGAPLSSDENKDTSNLASSAIKGGLDTLTAKISELAGESGSVDLRLRDLFSNVIKKHTRAASDEIFIAGTVHTTPDESEIAVAWPKPWLFSRVLLALLITFALLYICTVHFRNPLLIPGLMFIGALAMPFSVLIFMFETNAPRNISIFEVIKMFFVGGVASIVLTLLLFEIFPVTELNYWGALIVGFVEEVGKLLAIAIFVKILNPRFILNGMLIGAAIGAGFAVFETAGYGFRFYVISGFSMDVLMDVLFLRAWSSVGAHVAWAAIIGAGLVMVKGDAPFSINNIFKPRFLVFLLIPILLHAIWNSPLLAGSVTTVYIKLFLLIAAAWIVILVLLSAGLKQIKRITQGR